MGVVPGTRIVHLHIPKTAGTAFRSAFQKAAGGKLRIFPHYDERQYAGIDPSRFDFFSGHIGFETAAKLGGEIITVLRNPIDRFISVYYFWRQLYEKGIERNHKTILAHKFSLSEFVKIRDEPFVMEALYNTMTWQIAHGTSLAHRRKLREAGKTDDEVFELAVENLSTFSLVGVQERLELFEAAMVQRFSVPVTIRKINVTEARPGVEDIGAATISAIHDWSFLDLRLYEHAYKLVSESASDQGSA
jgi:Sulfotransferase family